MTWLLGVIGDPVSHSLSPVIHNMWIREHGFDASYEALRVERGNLGSALETLSERNALGFNITLPHKEDALELSDETSDIARRIGAANTLIRREQGGGAPRIRMRPALCAACWMPVSKWPDAG
jgi:shikimate dehydrogenase